MATLTLGISFRRAPIELLERLSFADDDLVKAYRRVDDLDAVHGAVVLSTCNRVEVTADVANYHAGFLALKRLLLESRGVGAEELSDPLYAHWERDAADHLFAVAAGLDSMVLGETQIHAQVREALRRAESQGTATPPLSALFHAASRAGRRVRRETSLGAAPDAFVALGADLAGDALGGLERRSVLIVGAGQMAALAVRHLRERRVGPVRILNRSLEHARVLADRTGADHGPLDALAVGLRDADLVVSATGAAGTVIDRDAVATAMTPRARRPIVLLDLAVPRDVDPRTAGLPSVRLIDIVSLRERLTDDDPTTAAGVAAAQAIVAEEVRRYELRRRGEQLAPLIRALRRRGDRVVEAEWARQAARLAGLSPDERAAVDAMANAIAAKLLHDPVVELKERSEPGGDGIHARVLAELFGIDPDAE